MLPAAPAVWVPGGVNSSKKKLDSLLQNARGKTEVSSKIPKLLRRFFRKQGGYNRAILDSIAALSKTNHELTQRVTDISTCLGQFNGWLLALHEQSDADANWMKAAAPALAKISEHESELKQVRGDLQTARESLIELGAAAGRDEQIDRRVSLLEKDVRDEAQSVGRETRELRQELDRLGDALKSAAARADAMGTELQASREQSAETARTAERARHELQAQIEQMALHLRNVQARADNQDGQLIQLQDAVARNPSMIKETEGRLQTQIDQAGLHLRSLQSQCDRLGVHINNLQAFVDKQTAETVATHRGLERRLDDHAGLEKKIAQIEERSTNETAFVKGELSEYGSLLRRLLGGDLEGGLPPRQNGAANKSTDAKAMRSLDAFYFSFENRFRGPREEIKKRIAVYLPFLRKARAGAAGRPVLDLGCGRGEWLEILKENKLVGEGVDLNSAMISQCKERHLKVRHGDALEHLRSLRANSQGGVTGFHIIEHLPFEVLMEVFRETRRVLKPGGVAIFESPNCKNLVVGACNFHIDPTHRHPVFPETAEFMLASHGFEKIQIEYLSPVTDVNFAADTKELAIVRDLLYGPQDFGIIAYKPKAR